MNCISCQTPFQRFDDAWKADNGQGGHDYYCKSCYSSRIWCLPGPEAGWIHVDFSGQKHWCAFTAAAVAGTITISGPPACTHPNFNYVNLKCPDCLAQISIFTCCGVCSHEYGYHSGGIKGPCNGNGPCACKAFVIPSSCIPKTMAIPPQTNVAMCTHPNLGQSLTCPDCNEHITSGEKCHNCYCEWRCHTNINAGKCKGPITNGVTSGCPISCPHFVFEPKPLPQKKPAGFTIQTVMFAADPTYETIDILKKPESIEDIRARRKKDGVCVECGDKGTFVNLQCMCNNGHGKIF